MKVTLRIKDLREEDLDTINDFLKTQYTTDREIENTNILIDDLAFYVKADDFEIKEITIYKYAREGKRI